MDLEDRIYKLNLNKKYETNLESDDIDGNTDRINNSNVGGKVTHLVQQLQQQVNDANQQQHQQQSKGHAAAATIGSEAFHMKKVGPLVPPKPSKKKHLQTDITCNNNNAKYECLYETAASANAAATGKCTTLDDITKVTKRANLNDYGGSGGGGGSNSGRSAMLLHCRPQNLCSVAGSNCSEKSFNAKITLDIPVVLDQQLEALTHHKMQLEKRGLLQPKQQQQQTQQHSQWKGQKQQQQQQKQQQAHINQLSTIPKLSSTSLLATELDSGIGIYTNLDATKNAATAAVTNVTDESNKMNFMPMQRAQHVEEEQDSALCYSNLSAIQPNKQKKQLLYTNMMSQQQQQPVSAPLPSMLKTLNLADLGSSSHQLLQNRSGNTADDDDDDEEIPPPPSPVSSSYSELRRATANNNTNLFNVMPVVATTTAITTAANQFSTGLKQIPQQQHQQQQHQQLQQLQQQQKQHYTLDGNNGGAGGSKMQNAYMNIHYNNDYSNNAYCPTLQSLSQASTDYYGYSSFSQGTSTYESIYEPINLRPTSQMSLTHSSNSLAYGSNSGGNGTGSGYQIDGGSDSGNNIASNNDAGGSNRNHHNQLYKNQDVYEHRLPHHGHHSLRHQTQPEVEVEALTNFLVHSMQPSNSANVNHDNDVDEDDDRIPHDDNYGICFKCNERILGETSGCTAMDQTYHIACFTCSQCQNNLQGKPFYALEGKPYCEYDYLQTLEKCSVCMEPILERILRATGKPYHPQCFTCIVCNKSLDGIPFTVDATNQNYCIADFHKKFAPRCCVCKEPIMPAAGEEETVRVVALDRSFHFECYKCEDCGLLLSSEADGRGCYPLDDHVLCKSCNANRVQMLTNRMTTEL